jgi:hypothetical protein
MDDVSWWFSDNYTSPERKKLNPIKDINVGLKFDGSDDYPINIGGPIRNAPTIIQDEKKYHGGNVVQSDFFEHPKADRDNKKLFDELKEFRKQLFSQSNLSSQQNLINKIYSDAYQTPIKSNHDSTVLSTYCKTDQVSNNESKPISQKNITSPYIDLKPIKSSTKTKIKSGFSNETFAYNYHATTTITNEKSGPLINQLLENRLSDLCT